MVENFIVGYNYGSIEVKRANFDFFLEVINFISVNHILVECATEPPKCKCWARYLHKLERTNKKTHCHKMGVYVHSRIKMDLFI